MLDKQGLSDHIELDSAGTHRYHVGNPPDPRTIEHGEAHGLKLSHLRGRQLQPEDYYHFDYILMADTTNLEDASPIDPGNGTAKVYKMLHFATKFDVEDVPDPYHGGPKGFTRVIDLIEDGMEGFLNHVLSEKELSAV
jgi:protein-tyrosine phosphatase